MVREYGLLTGVLVVVHKVEEDDGLHEDVSENRSDRDTDIVLLVSVMADIGLESQHFEDHMEDADHNRGAEEVNVGVEENLLDHFKLCSISTTRWHLTIGSISGGLLHTFINAGKKTELPVREMIEVDVNWETRDSRVQRHHVSPQLPEGVNEEHGIIPSILSTAISSTRRFRMNVLANSWVKSWIVHDT